MKSDDEIKCDVDNELKWNPEIDSADIATKVTGGAVTLSGFAANFHDIHQAEVSVKRVAGVVAIANDLAVRPTGADRLSDPELAREAVVALQVALPESWQNITIVVHDGRVLLEGTVEWQFQRERAIAAIRPLRGVLQVSNSLEVKPMTTASDVKSDIEAAFKRNAVVDANQIDVEVRGPEVTLRGEVRSWAERDQAYQTAWSAPGVINVVDELTIRT